MDGTPFGRYRLLELLGRGGMGEVWRAHDTVTDRVVAIKVLPAHLSEDEEFQRRFRREAHAAARLGTPHVVPIYDYGEIDGRLFVSMRLIEGRDLDTVLAAGPLEPARAVRIIDQVAKALHAAHKVGLIHRDIKPSNILLDDDDFAYLIDFGIARVADETRMTKSGNTIGTFAYIAPERLGTEVEEDARADIYSLACVLYEALTGQPPFPGSTTAQLMYAHVNTPPPRPSAAQPGVPAAVDDVVATGMAKDPDQRYATTVELANAAHNAITEPLAQPTPSPPTLPATEQAPVPPTERAGNHVPAQSMTVKAASLAPAKPSPPRPDTRTPPRQPWWRRGVIVIPAVLLTVAVIVAAIVITTQQHKNSNSPQIALPTGTQHREHTYGAQVTLPFTGLANPWGVAVDGTGAVYVADTNNNRVLKLAAGSTTPTVLPFTGLDTPGRMAVDSADNLYVVDENNWRVLKLAAGSSTQEVLPFTGLKNPAGVAVDSTGSVYVTDSYPNQVLKLAAGSSTQEVLPFTGLKNPAGVAVDRTGTLYVADYFNSRVLKLAAGSPTQEVLPWPQFPLSVAVDSTGTLYVTDLVKNRVLELAAGSSSPTEVPFAGLNKPYGVAVDAAGTVYVTDIGTNRVLKLPAG